MGDDPAALQRAATELRVHADAIRSTVPRLLPWQGDDVWTGRRADRLATNLDEDHHVLTHVAARIDDAADELLRRAQAASASAM